MMLLSSKFPWLPRFFRHHMEYWRAILSIVIVGSQNVFDAIFRTKLDPRTPLQWCSQCGPACAIMYVMHIIEECP